VNFIDAFRELGHESGDYLLLSKSGVLAHTPRMRMLAVHSPSVCCMFEEKKVEKSVAMASEALEVAAQQLRARL
jgi:hypothetical protein